MPNPRLGIEHVDVGKGMHGEHALAKPCGAEPRSPGFTNLASSPTVRVICAATTPGADFP